MGHNPKNSAVTEQFVWPRLFRSCVSICVGGVLGLIVSMIVTTANALPVVEDMLGRDCVVQDVVVVECAEGEHCCISTFIKNGALHNRTKCCASDEGCGLPSGPNDAGDWPPTCNKDSGGGSGCDGCDDLGVSPIQP